MSLGIGSQQKAEIMMQKQKKGTHLREGYDTGLRTAKEAAEEDIKLKKIFDTLLPCRRKTTDLTAMFQINCITGAFAS